MTVPDYPLRFHPIYQERLWGGDLHRRCLQADAPPDRPVGESWEIADRPEANTRVANGPLAGRTLRQVIADSPEALLGPRGDAAQPFPLLVKFIGSRDRLSLQVHPGDAYAGRHHAGELGKTELWYILHAEAEARLMIGFREPQTREAVRAAIAAGRLEGLVQDFPVRPGEAYFLPAGRLHAIGAGLLLAEIQENSDVTYRVYDYGRRDAAGKTRDLHVEQALEVLNFADTGNGRVESEVRECAGREIRILARDPHFFTNHELYHQPTEGPRLPGFQVIVVTEGRGRLGWGRGEEDLRPGSVLLLPAALDAYQLKPESEALGLLRTWVDGEDVCS